MPERELICTVIRIRNGWLIANPNDLGGASERFFAEWDDAAEYIRNRCVFPFPNKAEPRGPRD